MWTQAEVAAIGQVSVPTQVAYERGARTPSTDYLRRLRSAGFDVWHLLFDESTGDFVAENVDWNLLGRIAAAMQDWCISRRVEIRADKFGELLRVIYNEYRRKPATTSLDVGRILRLVS